MTITTSAAPASEKQAAFIAALLGQRQTALAVTVQIDTALTAGAMTKAQASGFIETLLAAPMRVVAGAKTVEPGYYLMDDTAYVVVKAKTSDNLYAKRLVLGTGKATWVYAKGAMALLATKGTAMTLEDAKAFGHLNGVCVRCGAALTDPDSVTAGVGPICAKAWA